jgi:hypothetical protein
MLFDRMTWTTKKKVLASGTCDRLNSLVAYMQLQSCIMAHR